MATRLNGKARAAAAARRRIRIADLERRAAERLDIIDLSARNQIEADRVHHQPHTVACSNVVVGLDALGQSEYVLEPRTASAFDREPQDSRLRLTRGNRRDARRSRGGKVDVWAVVHKRQIGVRGPNGKRNRYAENSVSEVALYHVPRGGGTDQRNHVRRVSGRPLLSAILQEKRRESVPSGAQKAIVQGRAENPGQYLPTKATEIAWGGPDGYCLARN